MDYYTIKKKVSAVVREKLGIDAVFLAAWVNAVHLYISSSKPRIVVLYLVNAIGLEH